MWPTKSRQKLKNSIKIFSMTNRMTITRLMPLLVCHLAMFCAMGQKQTSVTVKVYNNAGNSVSLYKVENGEARRMSFRWTINDTCVFSFPMEKEGVYYFGKTSGKGSNYNYVLYLKPGDNKWINAYSSKIAIDFDSCKIVKPNAETELLQKWTNVLNDYCKLGSNRAKRDEFIVSYDNLVKEADRLKKKAVLANKYFNALFASKVDAEILYPKAAAFFNFASRMNSGYDSIEKHGSFYQSLAGHKFCNAGLLYSEHGMQLLNYSLSYNLFQQSHDKEKMLATPLGEKAKSLCNDTVRGAFVTHYMSGVTNYEQFKRDVEPFKSSFVLPGMNKDYQQKLDEVTLYAKGLPAYNFSLHDSKGNLFSLSDFKGKVVVLDIWAMWCAPCLDEKPFFIKVEEEYKQRDDIAFVGVSVDGVDREDVWRGFVAKKGWKNIELISNYDESIMKYYKVEGIPRFMIFDKEGKIITVDAPRPSNPGFKKLIEQTLKNADRDSNP